MKICYEISMQNCGGEILLNQQSGMRIYMELGMIIGLQ
jgi:hypothetical protein